MMSILGIAYYFRFCTCSGGNSNYGSYGKWIRFFAPLVAIYMVIGTLIILLAGATGY